MADLAAVRARPLLLFRCGGRLLALPAHLSRQVVPMDTLSALPGSAGTLLGLTPAAGRAVPVVDLAGVLGADLPGGGPAPTLALITEQGGEFLALPASEVLGVLSSEQPDPSGDAPLGQPVRLSNFGEGRLLHLAALQQLVAQRLLPA
ncbi:chemotaxis protein CheW [Deinococcus petrolearius]|uniref:Chemotaxis protein CheW n=1 Tax=Deinococcus petrolearius TaxID=1751295 RepID=A0ABW1DPK7_9DEIO